MLIFSLQVVVCKVSSWQSSTVLERLLKARYRPCLLLVARTYQEIDKKEQSQSQIPENQTWDIPLLSSIFETTSVHPSWTHPWGPSRSVSRKIRVL